MKVPGARAVLSRDDADVIVSSVAVAAAAAAAAARCCLLLAFASIWRCVGIACDLRCIGGRARCPQ